MGIKVVSSGGGVAGAKLRQVVLLYTVGHWRFSAKVFPPIINVGFSSVNNQVWRALVRVEAVL